MDSLLLYGLRKHKTLRLKSYSLTLTISIALTKKKHIHRKLVRKARNLVYFSTHKSSPSSSCPMSTIMTVAEEKGAVDNYTEDGTVDLKGRPVLRSKTGGWKACSFIVGYEVFERMAYYGIASNLVVYLTDKLHEGTVQSSNNVSNWAGSVWLMPLVGAYIADAYLGRYWTFVIASCIYLMV